MQQLSPSLGVIFLQNRANLQSVFIPSTRSRQLSERSDISRPSFYARPRPAQSTVTRPCASRACTPRWRGVRGDEANGAHCPTLLPHAASQPAPRAATVGPHRLAGWSGALRTPVPPPRWPRAAAARDKATLGAAAPPPTFGSRRPALDAPFHTRNFPPKCPRSTGERLGCGSRRACGA